MGSRERREREREELRQKILDAAREMFARDGYEAVTMRKIAERIEYSPTAIYLHFADKDALLRELAVIDLNRFGHRFQRAARHADPMERLRALGKLYVEFALEHPSAYRLMFVHKQPPDLEQQLEGQPRPERDGYAFLRQTVEECIDGGRLRPGLKDAELVAQVVWSAMHGVVSLYLTMRDGGAIDWRPFEKRVRVMLDMITEGLAARG